MLNFDENLSEFRDTSQKMQTRIEICRTFANSCVTFPEISEIAEIIPSKKWLTHSPSDQGEGGGRGDGAPLHGSDAAAAGRRAAGARQGRRVQLAGGIFQNLPDSQAEIFEIWQNFANKPPPPPRTKPRRRVKQRIHCWFLNEG